MTVMTCAQGAKGGGTFAKTRLPAESVISNWKQLHASVKVKVAGCVPLLVALSLAWTVSLGAYESLSVMRE